MALDTLSTLEKIRTKVRRITKTPSTAQITDANIDEYINTFVLYDFPESLRLFAMRKTLTFYTSPYLDIYSTNTVDEDDPLYNFNDKYVSVHAPIYLAGQLVSFSQSMADFYANYPITEYKELLTTGNGITVNYTGTLKNFPILRNKVLFSSINAANAGLVVHDDGDGNLIGDVAAVGEIDYVTGVYDFTFNLAPGNGEEINSFTVPYTASKPTSVLYFNNEFVLRPVPDMPYRIEVTVFERPAELLAGERPELSQWWQYIALGACKKIFQDRMDFDSVALIEPEFQQQELMVLRRTIMQQSDQQVATIYNTNLNDVFSDN